MVFTLRSLTAGLAYRRLVRVLERHCVAQEETNVLLSRLVERFAPDVAPVATQAPVPRDQARLTAADRGDISHLDPDEMMVAQQFAANWEHQNGYPPSEEEVFAYLAENHTRQLAAELNESRRDPWSR